MRPSTKAVPRHTVILVHGIRTHANWYARAKAVFSVIKDIEVEPIKYGRVDLLRFLVPGPWRKQPVEKTEAKILPILENCKKNGRNVTIIAHSNGTKVITDILKKNHIFRFDNFIMCGSIVDTDYDWHAVSHKISGKIINDYGVKDIWPAFARSVTWGYGYSGTNGFGAPVIDRLHDTTHSAYFSADFMRDYWLSFFETGEVVDPHYGDREIPSSPWWFGLLEFPIKWALLVAAIAMSVLAFNSIKVFESGWSTFRGGGQDEPVTEKGKFVYYSIDGNRRPTANLGELTVDDLPGDLPLFEDIKVGTVLKALSLKNLRLEPTTNSAAEALDAGGCVRVIDGRKIKDDSPGSALSAGWLPVVVSRCSAEGLRAVDTPVTPASTGSDGDLTFQPTTNADRDDSSSATLGNALSPSVGEQSNKTKASNATAAREHRALHRMNVWLGYTSLWQDTDICLYINDKKPDCFRMGKGPTFSMIPVDVTDGDRWEIIGNVGRQSDSLPRYEYTSILRGSGLFKFPIYSDVSITSETMGDGNMIAKIEPGRPIQSVKN